MHSIDFDTSSLRYLDRNSILEKEKRALKYDMWALESEENFKKYHKLFEQKIAFLREAGPKKHQAALHEWWTNSVEELGINLDI